MHNYIYIRALNILGVNGTQFIYLRALKTLHLNGTQLYIYAGLWKYWIWTASNLVHNYMCVGLSKYWVWKAHNLYIFGLSRHLHLKGNQFDPQSYIYRALHIFDLNGTQLCICIGLSKYCIWTATNLMHNFIYIGLSIILGLNGTQFMYLRTL